MAHQHGSSQGSGADRGETSLEYEQRQLMNHHHLNEEVIMSKEEIWKKLEEKRFRELKHAAVNLQSDMLMMQSRCPKCTLPTPCKHYQNFHELISEAPHIV
jgi:hypothetical protein